MEIIDVPTPEPDADEVIVEVDWAGMCGSDAGIYAFKSAFERMNLPTIIGHEYAGRVVSMGEQVMAFERGERVVERPLRGCNTCYQCRRGNENVCQHAAITGVDHDGAYAPFIRVPADSLVSIPSDVEQRSAAMTEPTSIAVRAICRNSRIRPGDAVLVEGPGPIGILSAQVARAQGGQVIVSGINRDAEHRLPLAQELGFDTLNVEVDDCQAVREERTEGGGYDVVIDTTGHPSGLTTAVEEIKPGGQIVLVGLTGSTKLAYADIVRGEIDIQCSYASTIDDFERSFELIRSGAVDVESIIDERFSLQDVEEAFEAFRAGKTVKPVFDISELDS